MPKTRIKEICKQKKVRQIDLANILGMREDSFSLAVNNDTLSLSKLEKIAEYLGVNISELFPSTTHLKCPCCGAELQLVEKKEE